MFYRLSLALSLCFWVSFSANAQTYEITEAELTALETALTTAQAELSQSQTELTALRIDLIQLQKDSIALQNKLIQASESFNQYVLAKQRKRTILLVSLSATSALAIVFGVMALF